MSGGSYDYVYHHVEDAARSITPSTPLRRVFKQHLVKVAKALHDIEWVDSGDCGEGDEDEAIHACFGESVVIEILKQTIAEADSAAKQLGVAIGNARKEVIALKKGTKKGGGKKGC